MDADEQVSLHAPGFLHAHMQGHKKISFAREVSTHIGLLVNALAQLHGDLQHHIFFTRAARADSARVLATMPGVQGNDHQSVCCQGLGRRAHRSVLVR